MSEIVTIRMTATRAAQVAALERITGLSGVAAVVDFALATTLAQYREETEMETEDRGMDRQTFIDWFTGGEKLTRTISEDAARADIDMLSSDNGHDVSDAEMARYIGWLREEGVIED